MQQICKYFDRLVQFDFDVSEGLLVSLSHFIYAILRRIRNDILVSPELTVTLAQHISQLLPNVIKIKMTHFTPPDPDEFLSTFISLNPQISQVFNGNFPQNYSTIPQNPSMITQASPNILEIFINNLFTLEFFQHETGYVFLQYFGQDFTPHRSLRFVERHLKLYLLV